MVTHSNKIAELKAKYPTLKTGDDLTGYVELTPEEYEAKIAEWADAELAAEAADAAEVAKIEAAAAAKEALLERLGITADEAKLLLS
jgi:hypothetical protein